jgi:micrococcal nuclease
MYTYKCKVSRVIDGDTLSLSVDLGFNITNEIRVRLIDIDTPEVRGKDREFGLLVTEKVREWVKNAPGQLYVSTKKTGKYGRWLARIFYKDIELMPGKDIYLHEYLLANNYSKRPNDS